MVEPASGRAVLVGSASARIPGGVCIAIIATGLVGCGRLGFHAAPDASGGDGDDSMRATADAAGDAPPIEQLPGLVAWYPLDESAFIGSAVDASGGNRPALCTTGVNCPGSVAGKVGAAASFDGTTQRLRVPFDAAFTTATGFTIALWFSSAGIVGSHSMFSKPHAVSATANTWQLELPDSPMIRFKVRSAALADVSVYGPDATMDAWHHVAGAWDGSSLQLYVDGAFAGSSAVDDIIFDTSDLVIGADVNTAETNFFLGAVDDVRLYNRALGAAEVAMLASK